jgi:hypothetical protein
VPVNATVLLTNATFPEVAPMAIDKWHPVLAGRLCLPPASLTK